MPRKFDFISPGILLREVDESVITPETDDDGILLIGQSKMGPSMKPIKIRKWQDWVDTFGEPVNGLNQNSDVWRDGNNAAVTYAGYAAQAWLASNTSPVTFVRLLGEDQAAGARTNSYTAAGWDTTQWTEGNKSPSGTHTAYGLFLTPASTANGQNSVGVLGAIFYASGSALTLQDPAGQTSSVGVLFDSAGGSSPANTYSIDVRTEEGGINETITFHFDSTNSGGFIRQNANCNPMKLNSTNFGSSAKKQYFLGETFEESIKTYVTDISGAAGASSAILLPLVNSTKEWSNHNREATQAKTGWFINRNPNPTSAATSFAIMPQTASATITFTDVASNSQAMTLTDTLGNAVVFTTNDGSGHDTKYDLMAGAGEHRRQSATAYNIWINAAITEEQMTDTTYRSILAAYLHGDLHIKPVLRSGLGASTIIDLHQVYPGATGNKTITEALANCTKTDFTNGKDSSAKKLFRLVSLHEGEEFQKKYAIRIEIGQLGTTEAPNSLFSVVLVDMSGNEIERFSKCCLDPNDERFIGRKIGDQYLEYDATNKVYNARGSYPNNSDYIRVEMHSDWKAGISDDYKLPWGVYGPAKPVDVRAASGSYIPAPVTFVSASSVSDIHGGHHSGMTGSLSHNIATDERITFRFPELKLTSENTKNGDNYDADDVFGVRHVLNDEDLDSTIVAKSKCYNDIVRALPDSLDIHDESSSNMLKQSWIFSLDDIYKTSNPTKYYWRDGVHLAGHSFSEDVGTESMIDTTGIRKFNAPFFGGFDGIDITKADPFSSEAVLGTSKDTEHYAVYSIQKALDLVKDSELVRYDLISMPGVTHKGLTDNLIKNTEKRGDALAIIDLPNGFKQSYENSGLTTSQGSKSTVISSAKSRNYNSSYAATYYPNIKLGFGGDCTVPASVAALGAIAKSDSLSQGPWFAPAGFNRGGIKQLGGTNGPTVQGTTEYLKKKDRDDLYKVNVNPIARFPAINEIVIFGQKTMQQTPSALDRVNVRRLMIYLKKKIGDIANTILFQNNVRATWLNFTSRAENILTDVQTRFGITEFKLVLDETTTTADLIDRNILYAKVYVKPARAIEFVAIDFIITKTGIEF